MWDEACGIVRGLVSAPIMSFSRGHSRTVVVSPALHTGTTVPMMMSVSVPYSHRVLACAASRPPISPASTRRIALRIGFSSLIELLPLIRANFPQRLHSSRQTSQVKNGGDRGLAIGRGLGNETVGCQKLLEKGCGVARVERGRVICGERPLLILGRGRGPGIAEALGDRVVTGEPLQVSILGGAATDGLLEVTLRCG